MGYEVRYKYHEKLDDGGYNKEETLEMTKKVGDAYEDTSIEKLASVIMSQLARRDIWVVEWEVFEFKKAKITCKETKGGLIIKNKKFNFDGTSVVVTEEGPAAPPTPPGQQPHERVQPQVQHGDQPHNVGPRRAIKWVRLDNATLHNLFEAKQRGLKFSENKEYPVFSERPGTTFGESVYEMKDDLERDVSVNSKYFMPAKLLLSEERNMTSERMQEPGPRLLYDNVAPDPMPDLNQIKKGGQRAITAARQAASARDPEQLALQRAAAMRKAAMQKGMVQADDAGGQPMEMINLERNRASKRNDLAGVDMDMAAIVEASEAKTRQKAPPRKSGRQKQKVIPINPADDVDLSMEDEIEDMPDISRLRKRAQ